MIFFWGNTKMSYMRYLTFYSYRYQHPNDTMTLYMYDCKVINKRWVDNRQDASDYIGKDYTDKLDGLGVQIVEWKPPPFLTAMLFWEQITPVHCSDLFRWDYLNTIGGTYADSDILFVKPMAVMPENTDFALTYDTYFSIGVLSGRPNRFLQDYINLIIEDYDPDSYQVTGANSLYTLILGELVHTDFTKMDIWKMLQIKYPDVAFYNIPVQQYYEFASYRNNFSLDRLFKYTIPVPQYVHGIHWYGGDERSQQLNNALTPNNVHTFDNTFCNEARRML